MVLAMLFAVPVFEKQGFQKWVRLSFLANALVTPLIIVVYFTQIFQTSCYFLVCLGESLRQQRCYYLQ